MRHWSLLGIRNLRVKPGRSAGAVLAVALGVAIVVWITSAYESFMASVTDQVQAWVGHSQISIESSFLGLVDESLVAEVRELENIRLVCPKAKFHCRWIQPNDLAGETAPQDNLGSVDVVGIVPEVEYEFRTFRGLDQPLSDRSQPTYGRLLLPGERDKCMIEDALAAEHGLTIGDVIGVTSEPGGPVRRFEIVGRYVVRRVAQFQRPSLVVLLPELQSLRKMTGQVSVIDIILEDDSLEALRATTADIEKLIVDAGLNYPVSTAEARMRQLKEAQEFTEFLLGLLSAVALLTAIFVIVTTLSMGMIERLTQLGMMRCIGFSRLQLGVVTLCEIVPIGIAGVLAGVPLGIALTWLSVQTVPEYLQSMVISQWGIRTGVIGGLVTSILSGLIPAAQAMRVSPLAATRPRTNRRGPALVIAAALGGVLLLAGHEVGLKLVPGHLWFHKAVYSTATLTAYAGFALLTPAAVYFLSGFLAAIVARVLRIRRQLLHDQVAGTPWRSGTICTGFMVALSLGVCISVHVDSLLAGWDFPSRIPEGFVWMFQQVPREKLATARSVSGAKDVVGVTNFLCHVDSPNKRGVAIARFPTSMFVAVEVERFLDLTELEYLEGDPDQAKAHMIEGGYVLLPQDGANVLGLHVGDRVMIRHVFRKHEFEIAGIVKSPSLDIASAFFQMESQVLKAAGSSLIGSLADVEKYFGVDHVSLLLINMELPDQPAPAPEFFDAARPPDKITNEYMSELLFEWQDKLPQSASTIEALKPEVRAWREKTKQWVADGRSGKAPQTPERLRPFTGALRLVVRYFWFDSNPQERWQRFAEQVILHRIKHAVGRPNGFTGSIRQLKIMADREMARTMRLITTIPLIGLIVAALGAGNLMMANVTVRIRQIAILRAIGTTKWQVVRLILAEAFILGALGTAFGCAAGLYLARSINVATLAVWGYEPVWRVPWDMVLGGAALTMSICLIAGIFPARYAARSNIIAAMAAT